MIPLISDKFVQSHSDDDPIVPLKDDMDIDGDVLAQQVNNIFNLDSPSEEFDSDLLITRIAQHWCVDGILEWVMGHFCF